MNIKWVFPVIFFLFSVAACPSHASVDFDAKIHDLEKNLERLDGRERAKALGRIVDLYEKSSPKKAIKYCELLRDALQKLKDVEGVAGALYNLGNYYYYTGRYDKALGIYEQMIAHCKKNDLKTYLGRANVLTGRVYYKRGYYDTAMEYYERSLKIRKAINDKWGISCALNNIGHVYADLGDYTRAVKFQFESLKGYDRIGDKFGIGFSFENIGKAYFTLKNYDKALEFYLKSYDAYQEIQDFEFMAFGLLNVGNCYRMAGDPETALSYYTLGMDTAEKKDLGWAGAWAILYQAAVYNDTGEYDRAITMAAKAGDAFFKIEDLLGLYAVYKNFTIAYMETHHLDQALYYMEERLKTALQHNDRMIMADSYNTLGIIHTRQRNYPVALKLLEKARVLSEKVRSNDLISDNKKAKSTLHTALGDHRQGLAYFRQYQDIEDKKNSKVMKGKLLEIQKDYESQRLNLEKKVHRLYWVLAALAGCLAVYAIFRGFRHYHTELSRKTEKNRMLQVESKLKLYQARINPHFLFNSLDSVMQMGRNNDPAYLKQTLLKLSNVYRNLLALPDLPEIDLAQEMELVNDYLEIEKQISGGRIRFNIDLPHHFRRHRVIPLCVLTLVENAVKHGLAGKLSGGKINISVEHKEDLLLIRVADTGDGFALDQVDQGFGLYSIQKRLELHYQGKAFLNIESGKDTSTTATIGVPYEQS